MKSKDLGIRRLQKAISSAQAALYGGWKGSLDILIKEYREGVCAKVDGSYTFLGDKEALASQINFVVNSIAYPQIVNLVETDVDKAAKEADYFLNNYATELLFEGWITEEKCSNLSMIATQAGDEDNK